MSSQMYREFRVKELVEQTLKKAVDMVECSHDSDESTVIENVQKQEQDVKGELRLSFQETEKDSEGELSDSVFSLESGDAARAHWIQLQKFNMQSHVIRYALLYIVEKYKHIRPVWQFGLKIDESAKNWKNVLFKDFYFRNHSASIRSAITMIMENLDDREYMRKLLREIGAHHYFYDACEPHLEIFEQALLHSLRHNLVGYVKMDLETEQSWMSFLKDVKNFMGEGIAIQRSTYLRECVTQPEIVDIRSKWERIVEFGLQEAGEIVCERAIKNYEVLIKTYGLELSIPFNTTSEVFTQFAQMIMQAFEITINSYSEKTGFCTLVQEIREFVVTCMVLEMCPSFVRKAMQEGMFAMLKQALGETELNESVSRTWSKLYRALEQSIIANIVDY